MKKPKQVGWLVGWVVHLCILKYKYHFVDCLFNSSGCDPDRAKALALHVVSHCPHLKFSGLMIVGHLTDDKKTIECFRLMKDLRREILEEMRSRWLPVQPEEKDTNANGIEDNNCDFYFPRTEDEFELSMGMTADMEIAIAMGSTEVRVGTALFGLRRESG